MLKNVTLLHQRCHDLGFTAAEVLKLQLSFAALQFDIQNSETKEQSVRTINGDIVTDSESYDPSQYVDHHDAFTPTGLVKRKQRTSRRRAQRLKMKAIVENGVLSC